MSKGISLVDGDFTIKILSWYIWGQNSQPPIDKVANKEWIDRQDEITPKINPISFLQKGWEFEKFI